MVRKEQDPYKPIKPSKRGPGGWYCDRCGYVTRSLPEGIIACTQCGSLGLLGFSGYLPEKAPCLTAGCTQKVWIDGVNSDPVALRRIHLERHDIGDTLDGQPTL